MSQLYEEVRDDLFEFHEAYKLVSESGVSTTQLIEAAKRLEQIPSLETRLNNIKIEIQNSERQKQTGLVELGQLLSSIGTAKHGLNSWTEETNKKKVEFAILNSRNEQLKNIIARQKQTKEFRRVESIAAHRIGEILGSKEMMLHAALASIINAFREDPNKQLLIYDPVDYPMISSNSPIPPGMDPRYFKQFCEEKLLELAGKFYDKLLESSLSSTISSVDLAAP